MKQTYVRNSNGKVVHRSGCRRAGRLSLPWLWADGMTADQMVSTLANHPWIRPCKVCRPDKDKP